MPKKIIPLLLILMLLLLSCTSSQFSSGLNLKIGGKDKKSPTADVFKGFDGLKMEFIKAAPPDSVYHETTFPVALRIRNAGNYDLAEQKEQGEDRRAIMALGVERDYNCVLDFEKVVDIKWLDEFADRKFLCEEGEPPVKVASKERISFHLAGKSLTSPRGSEEIISYTVKAKTLEPQSESKLSTLYATLCYPYETRATTSVCVDTDVLGARYKKKVCSAKDVVMTDGQAAPIAVTKIETRMLPVKSDDNEELAVPHFVIHVENKANGQVVKNDKILDACSQAQTTDKDYRSIFNIVFVEAYLAADPNSPNTDESFKLDCEPKAPGADKDKGYIRLIGNKDLIRCTVPIVSGKKSDIALTSRFSRNIEPYTSPLSIVLRYGYTATLSKTYTIEKGVFQ